uniref:Filamin binding LIM protein 1 n=1 Tax=Calidris pygmaea TaxID=425635 RepID=A0A8C3IZT9_9CHAR
MPRAGGDRWGNGDICAFCHKALGPREPTVEAMRKQYHADCFTCRTCHRRLAGQRYYQRDGRPTCDACYQVPVLPRGTTGTLGRCGISRHVCVCVSHPQNHQATLEKCAKCQGVITESIIRALGKGYHPGCFSCAACGRAIGAETFAVDEQDEVFCVDDFYRPFFCMPYICAPHVTGA